MWHAIRARRRHAVEAKDADTGIDPSIRYYQERLRIPFVYQVVRDSTRDFVV